MSHTHEAWQATSNVFLWLGQSALLQSVIYALLCVLCPQPHVAIEKQIIELAGLISYAR